MVRLIPITSNTVPSFYFSFAPLQLSKKSKFSFSRGMTVTSGTVTIKKDTNNLIGISIGGGAPLCPCLYIVQIFDNTAASRDGTLQSGDEIVAVNNQSVKGKTKVEVAKMIQAAKVNFTFRKCLLEKRV